MTVSSEHAENDAQKLERLRGALDATRAAVNRVVIGQEAIVDLILVGLLANGHVLLEGPPGVGKTLIVRSLGQAAGLRFSRVQFTPDLMPADITGAQVLVPGEHGSHLEFRRGPIFAQLLLADEINRTTPRTQSALLEAMQEGTVSAGGSTMALPKPFFVLATQNPIEMEGTYTLPEAQIDRFLLRIDVPYPDEAALTRVLVETTGNTRVTTEAAMSGEDILDLQELVRLVPVADVVQQAVARFCISTQPNGPAARKSVARDVRLGFSPRGAQSMVMAGKAHAFMRGRNHLSVADLRAVLLPVARHRVHLSFEGRAAGADLDRLLLDLFDDATGHI